MRYSRKPQKQWQQSKPRFTAAQIEASRKAFDRNRSASPWLQPWGQDRESNNHCEAGVSRSRGVAVALAAIHGDEFPHTEHGLPNPHIVRAILTRHRERTGVEIAVPRAWRSKEGCLTHPSARRNGGIFQDATCTACNAPLVVVGRWDVLDPAQPLRTNRQSPDNTPTAQSGRR